MTATPRKPLILVVDDQPQLLQLYSRVLEHAGYNAVLALTARAALTLIQATPPDAVLVDLNMPFINGMGLLYRLRELYPDLPAAVMTGDASLNDETRNEIASLHAALHFKPMSNAYLRHAAGNLLS